MTVSRLVYAAHLGTTGTTVSPTAGTVTLDEGWSPYATADLSIPLPPPDVTAALDPRAGGRVTLALSQQFNSGMSVRDLSRGSRGTEVAEWTVDLADRPLSTWTGRYARPYNRAGHRPSHRRTLDLTIRSRDIDYKGATVGLRLASDEALLMDARNLDTVGRIPTTNTAAGVAALALAAIGAAAFLEADDVDLELGSTVWEPGVSAWDYVQPLMDAAGRRLWCDGNRVWHLGHPSGYSGRMIAVTPATVTALTETVDRDGRWCDSVFVTYRWNDSNGDEHVRYDVASNAASRRTRHVEYARPWPGAGAARALLDRESRRGTQVEAAAVADPTSGPGDVLRVTLPDGRVQAGYASRVEFDLGTDTMRVRSRDLADAGPNAWLLAPSGTAWQDIPAGVTWANYTPDDLETQEA